jgi:glycosyltransferase involved in cell wall biosynthesis
MNVLHVIQSLDPAAGGPPVMAARLAAAQAALGAQTRIVSYRYPDADLRIAAMIGTIPGIGAVGLEPLSPPGKLERIFARQARRRLASILQDVDLVHIHGVWDPLLYAAASHAAKLRKPYVLTPHGMLDTWSLQQKKWKKRLAMLLGYRRMMNRAAFLHFLNSDEHASVTRLGLSASSRIIPNGIFLEEMDPLPDRGAFRSAHPKLAQAKIILFLSRLHFKKGLDFLADAFAIIAAKFPDARLVVAGPDDGARIGFEAQIARLGLAHRVHLVGPLYGIQKLQALRDCNCFCLPSRQEGFSLAVTEAMACEIPVVISTECHFPEVASEGAGIVAALNAGAIAAGIETILGDPQAARRMGIAGRAMVISRFTWPKVAQAMIEGYRQVI